MNEENFCQEVKECLLASYGTLDVTTASLVAVGGD